MNNNLLGCFIKIAPYINKLTLNDIAVAVTDREKYLFYQPGKTLDHQVEIGDLLKKDSVVMKAMNTRERVVTRVDKKELFGVRYIGIALPVIENNKVVGSVFFGENTARQDSLREMADELALNTEDLSASSEEIAAQAQELSALLGELERYSDESHKKMTNIEEVSEFINSISSKTNMLGINAAIEAARVGAEGAGFGVVANEIRNLSNQSSESVEDIKKMLNSLEKKSRDIKESANSANNIAEEQAKVLENIAASTEEIKMQIDQLAEMADRLIEDSKGG
jgi:methyl-accepting chemotaxis protein